MHKIANFVWYKRLKFMKTITLQVDDNIADVFNSMDEDRKKQLQDSFENWIRPQRSLEQIMKDMSEEARQKGLTQEILDDLLKDE